MVKLRPRAGVGDRPSAHPLDLRLKAFFNIFNQLQSSRGMLHKHRELQCDVVASRLTLPAKCP